VRRALRPGCLAAVLVLGWGPGVARADGPWEGVWNAGPTRIRVEVESWGPDCGPRPRSTSAPAAGRVRVSQSGDHLTFHGRATRRTNGCWSENRAVRRVSSSYQSGTWRTTCRTPASDSRGETGTYTLRANGDDRLDFVDISRYDWELNESRCRATITSAQTFTRVGASGGSEPEEEEPEPERPACTPGDPARLRLRPTEARVEPGGEARFRARVVDGAGCPIPDRGVRWELRSPSAASAELRGGLFQAADTAAEAEGEFRVIATSGDLRAQATVVVRTPDLSDLIAKRTSGGVIQADAEDPVGESAAGIAARSVEDDGSGSWLWPVVGVGAAVVLFLGLGVVLILRRRGGAAVAGPRVSEPPRASGGVTAEGRASVPAPPPAGPRVCPVCRERFEGGAVGFCPTDGVRLVPTEQEAGPAVPGQALICPTCRRGFGEGSLCPNDGTELMAYDAFVERHKAAEKGAGERTKICPKCGDRYELTVTFCGKDGAELVLVN